jgi:hypothetical protein
MIKGIQVIKAGEKIEHYDLSSYSFMYRSNIKEIINKCFELIDKSERDNEGVSGTIVKHCSDPRIENTTIVVYNNTNANCLIMLVCTNTINQTALNRLLVKIKGETDLHRCITEVKDFNANYSKILESDPIIKIQREVDETKTILITSLDKLLERQGKLDDLLEKTNDLTTTSKVFLKQSKKMNRCCLLL